MKIYSRVFSIFYISLAVAVLGGCAVFAPDLTQPRNPDLPEAFVLYEPVSTQPGEWWRIFASDDLNRLIETAFESNLSIREAYARLAQAEASALKAGSVRIPEVDVTAGYSVSRQKIDLDSAMDGTSTTRRISAGLSVPTYELDLWGRVASVHEAARKDLAMSVEDMRGMYISVSAEIAMRWLEWVYQHQALAVLDLQIGANRQSLELMDTRFQFGKSTALDVYQQKQIVAAAESLRPGIEGRILELQNELSVLLGLPPGTDLGLMASQFPEPGALPDPGFPADLLARRPDVRRAGLALDAAQWRVAAARADRLPAIRLSGALTYSAEEMQNLFDNWIANLAASLVGPVFDAGRRRHEADRARAAADEKLATYRLTVLNAVREVQNALIRIETVKETVAAQSRQLDVARDGYRESLERYRNGTIDYLPVLTALSQSQQLERSLLQNRYQLLLNHVALHRALGGDWADQMDFNETSRQ